MSKPTDADRVAAREWASKRWVHESAVEAYVAGLAAGRAEGAAVERERAAAIAEGVEFAPVAADASLGLPPPIDITDGIPAELHIAIGRGRYDGEESQLAVDLNEAIRQQIAADIRRGAP